MDDVVAVTEGITTEDLIGFYNQGAFPWPVEDLNVVPWFSPSKRGVLDFQDFHLSKSTKKTFRHAGFKISFCKKFDEVILNCANISRSDQEGTWITEDILKSYKKMHELKKAYSVEVYQGSQMVGGLYGLISNRYVSAESMYFQVSGASKFALTELVKRLKTLGLSYLDTQMVTPVVKSFGGREIDKSEFLKRIKEGILLGDDFYERLAHESV